MPDLVATWDYPDAVRTFVANGIWGGGQQFPAESVGLAFASPGEGIVAGFVYHNWHPEAGVIEISGYSARRNWSTPDRVRELFRYPFEVVGIRMVVARHSENNTRARRIWKALGATETLIPDLRGPGEAEAVATLSRAAWERWSNKGKTYGQKLTAVTA